MAGDGFSAHLHDLFAGFGPISVRRMFGGAGVFHAGLMIGLVADDVLYLKVDGETRARFEAAGCRPFVYEAKGRPMTMSYCEAPGAALDDPAVMAEWARLAWDAARRQDERKPKRVGRTRRTRTAQATA